MDPTVLKLGMKKTSERRTRQTQTETETTTRQRQRLKRLRQQARCAAHVFYLESRLKSSGQAAVPGRAADEIAAEPHSAAANIHVPSHLRSTLAL